MWPRRSHTLSPLTRMASNKRKFEWMKVKQDAFDKIKRIVACDKLLTYPNFNETFKIHTNASAFQLGAVISQESKPIAFYTRKLPGAHQRYTVTKKEILSIIETLKEFRTILFGQKIIIYTDNKTLTYKSFNTDRLLIWRLIIKYYGPDIEYIKEKKYSIIGTINIALKWEQIDCKEFHLSKVNRARNK